MYGITLDPQSRLSQYRQLVDQLRAQISSGALAGGTKLSSTRELSESLGISRAIVLEAVDQLKMEGYLRTAHGSGTFVRQALVWENAKARPPAPAFRRDSAAALSQREERAQLLSFAPGMPDLSLFPRRQWLKCYHEAVEYASSEDLSYAPPSGRWDLRVAISEYLHAVKGIVSPPERIVVTSGSSQAFAILASIFDRARVVMEDPQAPFVRRVFDGLGCGLSYVPVDDEGIIPERIPEESFDLLYLTPNHQFPVGGTLSAERRVSVLHRARAAGAWVIEDDFDSEFRYEGHPVSPLAAMAPERVAYVGTFSKNVSPALRLGYLVVPQDLQVRVKTLKRRWDLWNEGLQQKAMGRFIADGHLARHLMRCHRAYGKKNSFLKSILAERLAPAWSVVGATTGMHLMIRRLSADASSYAAALKDRGLEVETVREYCQQNPNFGDSLIVAYGNRTESELLRLVDALADLG